jgi:hypothetical protein
MSATQILFQHELVNGGEPLVVVTGADEISWAYTLNVAEFPTYGGEVIQILSVYIDDMTIEGTLRQYSETESIYSFFMEYFTVASQGSTATSADKYTQVPMIMEYAHREWRFEIQPLEALGFTYATETVAPKWQMKAHVVDKSPDVSKLQELVVKEMEVGSTEQVNGKTVPSEFLSLKGTISPGSGNPAQNPFIAPGTFLGDKFVEATAKQAAEGAVKIGDYYNSLLPSYLNDTEFQALTALGAKPNFGNSGTGEIGTETLPGTRLKKKE